MEFLKNIRQLLRKPFPQEESNLGMIKTIIAISLFVMFFLYIFQPFDMNLMESGQFWICLIFGALTFFASVIYEFTVARWLRLKGEGVTFTFGRWIIYMIGVMLCISLANFVFVRLYFFGEIRWEYFHYMIRGTFAIGIFPAIILGGLALLGQERKYRGIADEINQKKADPNPVLHANDLAVFDIPVSQIRYVESLQNYVKVGYVNTEGQLIEQTERATLKGILDEVEGSPIVKCHRSFLVNREAVSSTSGNAQGLLLSLSDCDKTIPVSRSCVAVFRTQ